MGIMAQRIINNALYYPYTKSEKFRLTLQGSITLLFHLVMSSCREDKNPLNRCKIINYIFNFKNAQSGVETVFDHAITDDERIRLGLSTRDAYFEIFEGDTASVNAHLAVLAHIRGNLDARAEYIKRLPTDKLNEVLEFIMKGDMTQPESSTR